LNCDGVIREISNYIDGELELAVRQDLERHLEHCEHCQVTVDQTRLTVDIFCDEELVPLPADVKSRLRAALKRHISHGGKPA
jgi:anti-sigma factor RsiW